MNDYPLFSERLAIAERADEIIKKHHIKKDTFGVVCALALIGALKTPNEPETCKWNRVDPSAIVNPHTGLIHDDFQKFCEVCGKRIEAVK